MSTPKALHAIQGDPLKKSSVLFTVSYRKIAIQMIHILKWIAINKKGDLEYQIALIYLSKTY
jgi:hypothetical protein